MQRKWQRAWKRIQPNWLKYSFKVKNAANTAAKKIVPPVVAASLLLSSTFSAYANPAGGTVTTGAGSIVAQGNTMNITQNTNKLSINWQSFNIEANETVNFYQPNSGAIALNRIVGNNASAIYGHLNANGKVFLINPNGILFAKGSQVNVGGLVASTLNLSDKDFQNGHYIFSGDGKLGMVDNKGTITGTDNVVLLGPIVKNEGVIAANVSALAAGKKVVLDFNGDKLINVTVNTEATGETASNSGSIIANGGTVIMSAGTKDALMDTAVNNSGMIKAQSVNDVNGTIRLEGGTVINSGTLDAAGKDSGQTGGTVKVLGNTINLAEGSKIDVSGDNGGGTAIVGGNYQGKGPEKNATYTYVAKTASINADAVTSGNGGKVVVWANSKTDFIGTISAKGGATSGDGGNVEVSGKEKLIYNGLTDLRAENGKTGNLLLDPVDLTIAKSGGDTTGANVSNQLKTANVTIYSSNGTHGGTNGDINVNDDVRWDSNNALTLNAYGDVNVNADITATGNTAGLTIIFRTGGSGGYNLKMGKKVTLSGANPRLNIGGHDYMVINSLAALQNTNLDLAGYYALVKDVDASETSSWNEGAGFLPIGAGDIIYVGKPFSGYFEGNGHTISNLFINTSIPDVGLFGSISTAIIRNVGLDNINITAGVGSGYVFAGGLVGSNNGGSLVNSYCTGICSALPSTSDVATTSGYLGGLVGFNYGNITNCYNLCIVNNNGNPNFSTIGGLAGVNNGSIASSYNNGTVTANNIQGAIGGLVGAGQIGSSIINSFNTGDLNVIIGKYACPTIGGLIGSDYLGDITHCYSTGAITVYVPYYKDSFSGAEVGGLVGYCECGGTVINSHNEGNVTVTVDFFNSGTVGGLIGHIFETRIANSYNTGSVIGNNVSLAGGLVGRNEGGTITKSYNSGTVKGDGNCDSSYIGGLVAWNATTFPTAIANITQSYSTGAVTVGGGSGNWQGRIVGDSSSRMGAGLVGYNTGDISNSYSTSSVTDNGTNSVSQVGGLVGCNDGGGRITNSYSSGAVTGIGETGGLTGANYGVIINSFWDAQTSGQQHSAGSIDIDGLDTTKMMDHNNFTGWDFTNIWSMIDGVTYPQLRNMPVPPVITPPDPAPTPTNILGDWYTSSTGWADQPNWAEQLGISDYVYNTSNNTTTLPGVDSNSMKQVLKDNLTFAELASAAQTGTTIDGWSIYFRREDNGSGFNACAYRNNAGDIIVAFGGTNAVYGGNDWSREWNKKMDLLTDANISNAGGMQKQFDQADQFMCDLNRLIGVDLNAGDKAQLKEITGYSLGGGLAQYEALLWNKSAVTFDTAPITFSKEARQKLTEANNNPRVINFRANNDPLTTLGFTLKNIMDELRQEKMEFERTHTGFVLPDQEYYYLSMSFTDKVTANKNIIYTALRDLIGSEAGAKLAYAGLLEKIPFSHSGFLNLIDESATFYSGDFVNVGEVSGWGHDINGLISNMKTAITE